MRTVRDLGEFGLIRRLARLLPASDAVVEGIGDDCAVVKAGGRLLLMSCDLFVEDVHFRRATARPEDIGWKAAAAALSDIAAMGGTPLACLAALACPAETELAFLDALYRGLADAAADAGAVVAGGDTTRSPQGLVLDVTVLGEVAEGRYLSRRGARPGDVLAVTGCLGRSAAGLHALERGLDAPALVEAHRRPKPRCAEGRWLCHQREAHAMIDISDGLLQDAGHLAEAAGIGVDIEPEKLTLDPNLARYCTESGLDPMQFVLRGGEDYELAIAVASGAFDGVAQAFAEEFDTPLTAVGVFTDAPLGVRIAGAPADQTGYEHFR